MSYIRIANKAENVNRLYLEKLGLSTKRDDDLTIGQFGSGSKFAPIAALRNGWEWINVGEDDIGPYKMQYISMEESGIDCIFYLYNDSDLKSSSFTVDAGVLSWDSEFQIFREAFSNALDEFTSGGNSYSVDIVDEVKYEPGVFAVYLTAVPELLDIVDNFDKYFSIQRTEIAKFYNNCKIYDSSADNARFFYKGVLVHTDDNSNCRSLFDYELNSVVLNEERRVRNNWDIYSKVSHCFSILSATDDSHIDIASRLINNSHNAIWEWTIPSHYIDSYFVETEFSAFRVAWKNIHGDKIAVPTELMKYKAQFSLRDCEIVEVKSEVLYKMLERIGVPCASSVLGDEIEYDFFDLPAGKVDFYNRAKSIVTEFIPSFDHFVKDVKFFLPHGEQDCIYGVANMKTNEVYLSAVILDDLELLTSTLVHEYDHIATMFTDEESGFRAVADQHIGNLLVRLYDGGN